MVIVPGRSCDAHFFHADVVTFEAQNKWNVITVTVTISWPQMTCPMSRGTFVLSNESNIDGSTEGPFQSAAAYFLFLNKGDSLTGWYQLCCRHRASHRVCFGPANRWTGRPAVLRRPSGTGSVGHKYWPAERALSSSAMSGSVAQGSPGRSASVWYRNTGVVAHREPLHAHKRSDDGESSNNCNDQGSAFTWPSIMQ